MNKKELLFMANQWLKLPLNLEDKNLLSKLIEKEDYLGLHECFGEDLQFGTGGLRSTLGPGCAKINLFTIRKATHAVAKAVQDNFKKPKIIVGYDSRKLSFELANEVILQLQSLNIESLIFPSPNPVPYLSYAVKKLNASAGIMITASHNPKQYNGMKVYWDNGCQVVPPIDQMIMSIYQNLSNDLWFKEAPQSKINFVNDDIINSYHQDLYQNCFIQDLCKQKGKNFKVVYTPLHGAGGNACTKALKDLSADVIIVDEQFYPDGNFPSLDCPPNPENPKALKLAYELFLKEKADLVLGSDPDTDRLGTIVLHKNKAHYLNGNEMAAIMLEYLCTHQKNISNGHVFKSIVTTHLLDKIAHNHNLKIHTTLTGFKWMLSEWDKVKKNDSSARFVFASEESFGHLHHDRCFDKDGVSSAFLACEMGIFYKEQGKTLVDALNDIYSKYGIHKEDLLDYTFEGSKGKEIMNSIMSLFRSCDKTLIQDFKIQTIEDYLTQESLQLKTQFKNKLEIPKSNVLGLILENGDKIYLRPSGTEPKIKFYFLMEGLNSTEKIENTKKIIKDIMKSFE